MGLFSSCAVNEKGNENFSGGGENIGDVVDGEMALPQVDFSLTDEDMFSTRDSKTDYDKDEAIFVKLNGKGAKCEAEGVRIAGSKVTLTEEATYVISGSLSDGMSVVDAEENAKIHLIFDGVDITSRTSAALYILSADKVHVTLSEDTENTLENGGAFAALDENNIDGALFSKEDLTINGSGRLTVTSPAGHGIVCKDDLVLTGGEYTINSASHGIDANDSVRIKGAKITFDAGKDAIHVENKDDLSKGFIYFSDGKIQGEAEGDGMDAGAYIQIAGGEIDLLLGGGYENGTKEKSDFFGGFMGGKKRPGGMKPMAYGENLSTEEGQSMKGLKAENSICISDGKITISSADDAIHSGMDIILCGGDFEIASGDDALHADGNFTVTAGKINVTNSYEGVEALHILVQGGEITLVASDDGFNAAGGKDQSGSSGGRDGKFGGGHGGMGFFSSNSNGSIEISQGVVNITASGDGMDANGTLKISGGNITVSGPLHGDTAVLDYDKTGEISGGTFIGTGSTMMAQSLSSDEQGVIFTKAGNKAANTILALKDKAGKEILSCKPELDFNLVVLSSPDIVKGEEYTLVIGDMENKIKAN